MSDIIHSGSMAIPSSLLMTLCKAVFGQINKKMAEESNLHPAGLLSMLATRGSRATVGPFCSKEH